MIRAIVDLRIKKGSLGGDMAELVNIVRRGWVMVFLIGFRPLHLILSFD
jgi:hypothetical protein